MVASDKPIRIAIVGAGAVSDYHHVPAIRLDRRAVLVAACDTSSELLEKRRQDWGITQLTTNYQDICTSKDVAKCARCIMLLATTASFI
jgi:predicted dehydrogenase